MKNIVLFFLIGLLFMTASCPGQAEHPKREFRAAWIATVVNLDWPSTPNLNASVQQDQLIALLDDLKAIGINVVIFQIRTECDAFYPSDIEPWSYWLTGKQGSPPSPYYDPLQFAIDEAHKRGMEIHAWFNPYRAKRDINGYTVASNHVTVTHPEWIILKGSIKILDPGIPAVREYVTKVIMDVVNRYDIDGVHFDDYFYPYEGMNNSDDQTTWNLYHGTFSDRGDWRRDNVNQLISMIHDSIQVVKPFVKFGISPFGIWKSGTPSGIVGLSSYYDIYCDPMAWLDAGTIDYLTPQLYWPFDGGQDYGKLLPWWADSVTAHNRHLYPGQAAYRIDGSDWSATEVPNQIQLNRETESVYGSVFFRAKVGLLDNPKGFADSLQNHYYKYKSLLPQMDWKDNIAPDVPQNLAYTSKVPKGPYNLNWELPVIKSDDDSAYRYVVYRFAESPQPSDIDDSKNILDICGTKEYAPSIPTTEADAYYYLVTALDRNYNESGMSNVISISPPSAPLIVSPMDSAKNVADTTKLVWNYVPQAGQYQVDIAENETFENIFNASSNIADTFMTITGLEGLSTYYWRVKAANAGGISPSGSITSFTTGFPVTPNPAFPRSGSVNVPLTIDLKWFSSDSAASYRFQLATGQFFNDDQLVKDTVLTDTLVHLENLAAYKRYYWHVAAKNQFGKSNYSDTWAFRTTDVTGIIFAGKEPLKFELSPNYPNPFNPLTTIKFSIEKPGHTQLAVYNVLGQMVARLLDQDMPAGRYNVNFDGNGLASGIYIYRLINSGRIESRKMMLIK